MSSDVLIVGDTITTPELRHELPTAIHQAGLYVERGTTRHAIFDALEIEPLDEFDRLSVTPLQEFGLDELIGERGYRNALMEVAARACERLNLASAVVPGEFPLEVADFLRERGISVVPNGDMFDLRRRAKTAVEIEGIRRTQHACERAMHELYAAIRDGERSVRALKARADRLLAEVGVHSESMVIAHGPQTADPFDFGSGEIEAGEPIIVDIYPQESRSACFADMTRTFCLGPAPDRLRELHALCVRVVQEVTAAVRPGVRTMELVELACGLMRDAGHSTFLDVGPDETLTEGALHLLGHGVGLEMWEEPQLWMEDTELIVGDVISVEPGLYYPGWGGCRVEDLVMVVEDGVEVLTDFHYEFEL